MNMHSLDDIMTSIRKDIAKYNALLNAWKGVTYPTKKNGKPFSIMSKNIEGAEYKSTDYALRNTEKVLTVYTFEKDMGVGYVSDTIYCYALIENMTDERAKNKPQNILPKEPMLSQMYLYDLDDIKQAVNDRINQIEKKIANLEEQLEIVPTAYKEFKDEYYKAVQKLKEQTKYETSGSVFYDIKDTVINSFC